MIEVCLSALLLVFLYFYYRGGKKQQKVIHPKERHLNRRQRRELKHIVLGKLIYAVQTQLPQVTEDEIDCQHKLISTPKEKLILIKLSITLTEEKRKAMLAFCHCVVGLWETVFALREKSLTQPAAQLLGEKEERPVYLLVDDVLLDFVSKALSNALEVLKNQGQIPNLLKQFSLQAEFTIHRGKTSKTIRVEKGEL